MILVVGATGYLGRATVQRLLERGIPVRAMTRTPTKAADLQKLGAEVVQGDLIDPASLAAACQGIRAVVSAAHSMLGTGKYSSAAVDGQGHRRLIDAAKAAGVQHFVYASALGVGPDHPVDFCRTKFEIEQYLKASGLTYTILRPSAFMEWHVHNFLGKDILEKGKVTLLGKGNNPNNFVSAQDVARYAVLALTDPEACNQTIEIGGEGNFTKQQVAELYFRLSGKPAKIGHLPQAMLRVMSVAMKPIKPEIARIMLFSYVTDTTDSVFDPVNTLARFPVPLTSLEDFVRAKVNEAKAG